MGEKATIMKVNEFLLSTLLGSDKDQLPERSASLLSLIRRDKVEKPVITIAYGSAARIAGASATLEGIERFTSEYPADCTVLKVGASLPVQFEPVVTIQLPGKNRLYFRNITDDKVDSLLSAVFHQDIPKEDLIGQEGQQGITLWPAIPFLNDLSWFRAQRRVVLANSGLIDPSSIEEYIARGGYKTFLKVISSYTLEEVCDIVEQSGLRGRSGGGFLTGKKWRYALMSPSPVRYLICNAKESDPGAFTDRAIMESDPHLLIEGIAISAYAIGASQAIIYIRRDSDLAIELIRTAIESARIYGLLGDNIYSSGFNLTIKVQVEPGAFVCGEETALIESLEGRRGMPQLKPPFPTSSGLNGRPTVINNVETIANIPIIMKNGPDWFYGIGSESSKGTKIFSISGKGRYTGVAEVEMGISIGRILEDIAGGSRESKEIKAVQLGGVSGSFVPPYLFDLKIDYDDLKGHVAGMGAGGFLILDKDTCIVDLVRYFMEYIHHESCGKCIPCREGTRRMFRIMQSIITRPVSDEPGVTLERFKGVMQLETIARVMKDTSLCGLGQTAPNPFLSALNIFRDEFEEHIFDRKCEASVCRGLRTYVIDVDKCNGCTACASRCPANAIYGTKLQPFFIVDEKCTGCGLCFPACKFNAISIK